MRRVIAVLVLGFCAFPAAACGGTQVTAIADHAPPAPAPVRIAHREARQFGEPQARITRIEAVRIAGARPGHERWWMIRLQGRRAFRVGCPRPGPGLPGPCDARYLEVGIDRTTDRVGLTWGLTASEVAAVAKARKASRWLRIFPDTPALHLRCAIPRGGTQPAPGKTLAGTCSTLTTPSDHVRRVEFVQTWRLEPGGGLSTARWIVTLARNGRVASIRVQGQPPQLWK